MSGRMYAWPSSEQDKRRIERVQAIMQRHQEHKQNQMMKEVAEEAARIEARRTAPFAAARELREKLARDGASHGSQNAFLFLVPTKSVQEFSIPPSLCMNF